MAFTADFVQFKKKVNSTKQPAANTDVTWSTTVELLEPCSVINPRLVIHRSNAPYPAEPGNTMDIYNYCWLYEFSRYYWIRNWTWDDGMWIADLEVDVLASFKSSIGSQNYYVLRASASSNGNIIDNFYPTTSISYAASEDNAWTPQSYGSGCYIVNVIGTQTSGNSTLYRFTPTEFRQFLQKVYVNIDGFQFNDILEGLNKLLQGSPEQLITSAMWMPTFNWSTTTMSDVTVGSWSSGVSGDLITNPVFQYPALTLSLPKHPQAASRGSFLNLSPYTTYTLYLPEFGSINIDTTAVKEASSITINQWVDALSGLVKCQVHSSGNPRPVIANLTNQLGVAVPLKGQSSGSSVAGGIVSTLAGTVGAIATGGTSLAIGAAASAFGTAITALSGSSMSTSSMGGALTLQTGPRLDATFLQIASEDNSTNGRPLCSKTSPSSLGSGFIKVLKGETPIYGTQEEADRIKAFLEGGFFYE
jgi:hypothetical protein